MKLLVVEDEKELLHDICRYLHAEGFVCESATDFQTAHQKMHLYEYDIAIIDISLPGGSGLELIRSLKKEKAGTGIIIISARNALQDKLTGLDLGADDYMTKPFHLAELHSRIRALQRRRFLNGEDSIRFREITLNPGSGIASVNETPLNLTRKEFELLLFFMVNRKRLLTMEAIAEHLWGDHIDMADNFRFVYTHINNLKKKIRIAGGNDYIRNMYGMGYKMSDT